MEKLIWVARGTHLGHYGKHINVIWSSMRENLSLEGCEQQSRRPACASALSTGVYLLDFFCSGIQFNLLLSPYPCFISLLYLDLYVLGDDALIS